MKYDPIMCMMVPDAVKTKDAEFQMYGPEFHHPIIKASSKEEAIKKAKEIYGWGGKVEAVKVSDEKSLDKAIRNCDSRVSTRNVVTSNIAFEEIKKMTGIIPEKVQQKGDTMEFYHSGVKVAEWDMNNAEVKVFV